MRYAIAFMYLAFGLIGTMGLITPEKDFSNSTILYTLIVMISSMYLADVVEDK